MKLNNKGFAISTIMYMILVMAIILITLTLSLLSSRKIILDKTKQEAKNNIYNVHDISYRETLKILKEESITYANNNNIQKDSIKISELNSSISKEILDDYELSDKYLTVDLNDSIYDVYLGNSVVVSNFDEKIDNLIDIIDYKIYGNSVQEGENLFDGTYKEGYISSSKVSGFGENVSNRYLIVMPCEPNTSYVIEKEYATNRFSVGFADEYPYTDYTLTGVVINYTSKKIIARSTENSKYLVAFVYNKTVDTLPLPNITIYKDVSINNPIEIQNVGDLVTDSSDSNYGKYKIPITVSGKNLLKTKGVYSWKSYSSYTNNYVDGYNESDIVQNYINNGAMRFNATAYYGNLDAMIKLKPNTTYTYGIEYISDEETDMSAKVQLSAYKPNETGVRYSLGDFINLSETTNDGYYKFTTNDTDLLYGFATSGSGNCSGSCVVKYKLYVYEVDDEENNHEYEPYFEPIINNIYLDSPLRKIDSYSDYIDFTSKKIGRNINIINLATASSISYIGPDDGTLTRFYYSVPNRLVYNNGNNIQLMCKQLKVLTYNDYLNFSIEGMSSNLKNEAIFVRMKSNLVGTTLDEVRAYLTEHPLEVGYILSTPIEEAIELPKISTNEGTTILSVDTNVPPSNVEFTIIKKIRQL